MIDSRFGIWIVHKIISFFSKKFLQWIKCASHVLFSGESPFQLRLSRSGCSFGVDGSRTSRTLSGPAQLHVLRTTSPLRSSKKYLLFSSGIFYLLYTYLLFRSLTCPITAKWDIFCVKFVNCNLTKLEKMICEFRFDQRQILLLNLFLSQS